MRPSRQGQTKRAAPSAPALSAQRAFVVHLGPGGRSGRRRFTGRVEHLRSGDTAQFSSLKELLAFFAAAVETAQRPHGETVTAEAAAIRPPRDPLGDGAPRPP